MERPSPRVTPLDPSSYRRVPWKNGRGVTMDIAFEREVWRFSRTPITEPGPFSDHAGLDRLLVLVAGSGLVLETPGGEIDARRPFRPVRFAGETPVVSRLEAGPVEVVNLLGDRSRVAIDLAVLDAGGTRRLGEGTHIAYCAGGQAVLTLAGQEHPIDADGGLRIDGVADVATCTAGLVVLGSVRCVSR